MNASANTKRILITCPHLSVTGGVSNYYNSILPYLSKHFDVSVLEIGSRSVKGKRTFHPLFDQLKFWRQTKQAYDLVHVNPSLGLLSFIRDGLFVWQARKNNIPVLVYFRGWDKKFEVFVSKYLRWFFLLTYCKAQSFVVLSSEFKACLREWGAYTPIFIGTTTVNDSLIANFDNSSRSFDRDKTKSTNVLFLSRIEKDKGVFETIDAIIYLSNKGYNLSLTIAGDGTARKTAEEYVASRNVSNNIIRFIGNVCGEDKIKAFTDNDIFCLPTSYGEGLPNAVLEAMAFGLPILTCQTGGITDFFQNEKMGYIIDKENKIEIGKYIEYLINNPKLMKDISRYNHKYAIDNFLSSLVADKLRLIYEETT